MFQFRQITLNLLYFLNVLLIFLLLVEDKVQLPLFLQVTGRMHPLMLHFPLVLLFVGIFLELITRKNFQHPAAEKITAYIFYLFAVTAALAALFGFFLYKEGSYLGDEIILHKWTGTAVSLLAVVIIWLKERPSVLFYYATLGVSAYALLWQVIWDQKSRTAKDFSLSRSEISRILLQLNMRIVPLFLGT